ncbi:hypothetical protein [Leisingera sp. M658]|uniref:hypothetical protein n=1 Tax=Leisingera sp. M658 TaxID=2867015 RepID=UPI0021A6F166|nr:hypothetical protein [Leisingera sp. M658]UWQ77379.1 hypothetical protein K3724_22605 [Leisingera sp. M658]
MTSPSIRIETADLVMAICDEPEPLAYIIGQISEASYPPLIADHRDQMDDPEKTAAYLRNLSDLLDPKASVSAVAQQVINGIKPQAANGIPQARIEPPANSDDEAPCPADVRSTDELLKTIAELQELVIEARDIVTTEYDAWGNTYASGGTMTRDPDEIVARMTMRSMERFIVKAERLLETPISAKEHGNWQTQDTWVRKRGDFLLQVRRQDTEDFTWRVVKIVDDDETGELVKAGSSSSRDGAIRDANWVLL